MNSAQNGRQLNTFKATKLILPISTQQLMHSWMRIFNIGKYKFQNIFQCACGIITHHSPQGLKSHILMEGSTVTGSGRSLRRIVGWLLVDVDSSSEVLESSSSSMKCLEPETERRLAIRGWKAVEPTASKWNQRLLKDWQQRSQLRRCYRCVL